MSIEKTSIQIRTDSRVIDRFGNLCGSRGESYGAGLARLLDLAEAAQGLEGISEERARLLDGLAGVLGTNRLGAIVQLANELPEEVIRGALVREAQSLPPAGG